MRAVLCASICNCHHSLKAHDDEELVEAVLEHMKLCHPAAPVDEEHIRNIVSTRAYDIEYVVVYPEGYGSQAMIGFRRS